MILCSGFRWGASIAVVAGLLAGRSPVVEAGMIADWACQHNVSDSTGSYNATPVNETTYAAGMIGQAISFDGVSRAAAVPNMGTYPLPHRFRMGQ